MFKFYFEADGLIANMVSGKLCKSLKPLILAYNSRHPIRAICRLHDFKDNAITDTKDPRYYEYFDAGYKIIVTINEKYVVFQSILQPKGRPYSEFYPMNPTFASFLSDPDTGPVPPLPEMRDFEAEFFNMENVRGSRVTRYNGNDFDCTEKIEHIAEKISSLESDIFSSFSR